jgi:hypothetical protein
LASRKAIKADPQAVRAELERRKAQANAFSDEAFCGKHLKQLAYVRSTARYVVAICSRRAAKSYGNAKILANTALARPNVTSVYIGITERQVRRAFFNKIWKPMIRRYKLPATSTEDMVTTFENGSVVHFGSLQNENHTGTWLGDSLAGGVCIIDECQEASDELLRAAERVIEPCLKDITEECPVPGRLIWSGTFPDTNVGRMWDLFCEKDNPNSSYEVHNWNRFDNPFLINQREALQEVLDRLHVTEDEPFIQREYFGRPLYDGKATAYGYRPDANSYRGPSPPWLAGLELAPFKVTAMQPPEPCTMFLVGIDPAGTSDRYAIEVFGFGPGSNRLYHVFEAITEKAANPIQSEADNVLVAIKRNYQVIAWIRDYGSAKVIDDSLVREKGIGPIQPAIKAALKSRVDRARDLLMTRRMFIMEGSELATDLATARWDLDARARGQWKWASVCHPDAGDAAIYVLPHYVDAHEPQPAAESWIDRMERLRDQEPSRTQYGYVDPDRPPDPYDRTYGGGFSRG